MCVVKTTRSPVLRYDTLTAHPGAGRLGEAKGEAERARASGGEHGVCVGGVDGGRDGGDVVGQEGLGRRATFAVLREVGGTGESRLLGEDAECGHEGSAERTGGLGQEQGDADVAVERVGVLARCGIDEARARGAVVLCVCVCPARVSV